VGGPGQPGQRDLGAWPVLEDQPAIDVVEDPIEQDGRQQDIVQEADERDEVGQQVDRVRQVEDRRGQGDLRRARQQWIDGQAPDQPGDVGQGPKQRFHAAPIPDSRRPAR
jgi:hypothetical protein